MHNNFIDKNRRFINFRNSEVKGVLPEYFQQSFPQFITLLEKYYDWQEGEQLRTNLDNPAELLHHIFSARDITETDITLLSFIEDELLLGDAYFEGFGQTEAELRAAANFSNILFRSKGTKFAIEWFFRSFYGVDAEVSYPKKDIFNIGESFSQIGPQSNKFITNDTLYQTWSLLLKSSIPISRWEEIFKLFAHPAGMYLAGEVIIDGEYSSSLTPMGVDSAVTTRTTPTYSLAASPSNSEDEGSVFTYTLTGNNLPNDGGIAYYYVTNITTSDDDFLVVPPDVTSPEVFGIDAGTGSFTITTRRDTDETEGDETFGVTVLDDELRTIASDTVTIGDVVSQYTLETIGSVGGALVTQDEGTTFEYKVTGVTGTTPQEDHILEYYINQVSGVPVVDSDFMPGNFPLTGSAANVLISNDSGRFSLQTRIDARSGDDGLFQTQIRTPAGVSKGTSSDCKMSNVAYTFTATTEPVIQESDSDFTIDLIVDPTTVGLTADWSVDSDCDGRLPITSGSFEITSTNMEDIFLTEITPSLNYQDGTKQFANLTVTTNSIYNPEFTTSISKQIENDDPTFEITTDPLFAKEGETIDIVVNSTNAVPGTYYYFVEHITTTNADFSVTPPLSGSRQSFTISGNSTTITSAFTFTNTGDPDQDFRIYISDAPSGGVLTSVVFTISDAAQTYSLSSSTETPSEGDTVTMTLTTSDIDGDYYYWIDGTNVSSSDFDSGYGSSSSRAIVEVTSGTGTFDIVIAEDGVAEGVETVNVNVSKVIYGGAVATDTFAIQASTAPDIYDVEITTSGESTNVAREEKDFFVNVTGSVANTLYVEITGIGTDRLAVSETQKVINFFGGTQNGGAHVTLQNLDYQGSEIGTATVSTGNYASSGGTIVGSQTFSFLDASSLYTLSSNVSSANEGDTVTYTFDGSNVPAGTYVHHNTAIKGKELATVYSPSDTRIFLNNTTGLVNGMKCLNSIDTGFSSEITNVGSTFVDISPAIPGDAPSVSTGLKIYWGYDADKNDTTEFVTEFTFATGTPDTEVFTVEFLEDGDAGVENIVWGVYDDDGNQLVTKSVSISGDDLQVIISDDDSAFYQTTDTSSTVVATLEFSPDGKILVPDDFTQQSHDTGETWISNPADPSFDGADYRIVATLESETGVGTVFGEFGVVRDLSVLRTWQVTVQDPNFQKDAVITFQVYENGNISNSDTWNSVTIRARELYTESGGDLP